VNPASGTHIRGFVFDGQGVSNANLAPLSFGVFARFANDVRVERNRFVGTVQAITNTGGDRWRITHNRIEQLTLFDCTVRCSGGDGIIIALAIRRLGRARWCLGRDQPPRRQRDLRQRDRGSATRRLRHLFDGRRAAAVG
jgi:hypothetical protein